MATERKSTMPTQTREDRALTAIRENRVSLYPGTAGERGYALVKGNRETTYVVSHEGCCCPDAQKRDPKGCWHALCVRWLCDGYRQHRARQAPLSAILMAALAAYHTEQEATQAAPAPAEVQASSASNEWRQGTIGADSASIFSRPSRPRLVIDGEVMPEPTFVTAPTRLPRSDRPDPEAA